MNKDVLKFQDVVDINSTDKTKVWTILLVLLNGSDNIDAFQALADILQEKGFEVILVLDKKTFDMIDKTSGYVKEVFDCDPIPDLPQNIGEVALNGLNGSSIDKIKNLSHKIVVQKFEFVQRCEQFNENLVKRMRPELIIIESFVCSPVLTNCGVPWVWINFSPPNICKNDNRIPPGWSGLSIEKANEFSAFREEWKHIFKDLKNRINSWCSSKGAPDLPENIFHPHSPYLNIYVYPLELDFKLFNTWEFKDWIQVDCLSKRKTPKKLIIPELLRCGQGKLIYLSMGSYASVDIIKRLIHILSESPNKLIVSKGPFHSQYHLPNNMWGLEDIPLTDIIQNVNLVITCGDTKTIIECLLNAKPMIVLPLFGDQLDNRIRLKENGFGWGLDPFTCNKETLLCMIDDIIDDKPLNRRLNTIAKSMDCLQTNKRIADQIHNLIDRLQEHKKIHPNIETLGLFSRNKPQTTIMAED